MHPGSPPPSGSSGNSSGKDGEVKVEGIQSPPPRKLKNFKWGNGNTDLFHKDHDEHQTPKRFVLEDGSTFTTGNLGNKPAFIDKELTPVIPVNEPTHIMNVNVTTNGSDKPAVVAPSGKTVNFENDPVLPTGPPPLPPNQQAMEGQAAQGVHTSNKPPLANADDAQVQPVVIGASAPTTITVGPIAADNKDNSDKSKDVKGTNPEQTDEDKVQAKLDEAIKTVEDLTAEQEVSENQPKGKGATRSTPTAPQTPPVNPNRQDQTSLSPANNTANNSTGGVNKGVPLPDQQRLNSINPLLGGTQGTAPATQQMAPLAQQPTIDGQVPPLAPYSTQPLIQTQIPDQGSIQQQIPLPYQPNAQMPPQNQPGFPQQQMPPQNPPGSYWSSWLPTNWLSQPDPTNGPHNQNFPAAPNQPMGGQPGGPSGTGISPQPPGGDTSPGGNQANPAGAVQTPGLTTPQLVNPANTTVNGEANNITPQHPVPQTPGYQGATAPPQPGSVPKPSTEALPIAGPQGNLHDFITPAPRSITNAHREQAARAALQAQELSEPPSYYNDGTPKGPGNINLKSSKLPKKLNIRQTAEPKVRKVKQGAVPEDQDSSTELDNLSQKMWNKEYNPYKYAPKELQLSLHKLLMEPLDDELAQDHSVLSDEEGHCPLIPEEETIIKQAAHQQVQKDLQKRFESANSSKRDAAFKKKFGKKGKTPSSEDIQRWNRQQAPNLYCESENFKPNDDLLRDKETTMRKELKESYQKHAQENERRKWEKHQLQFLRKAKVLGEDPTDKEEEILEKVIRNDGLALRPELYGDPKDFKIQRTRTGEVCIEPSQMADTVLAVQGSDGIVRKKEWQLSEDDKKILRSSAQKRAQRDAREIFERKSEPSLMAEVAAVRQAGVAGTDKELKDKLLKEKEPRLYGDCQFFEEGKDHLFALENAASDARFRGAKTYELKEERQMWEYDQKRMIDEHCGKRGKTYSEQEEYEKRKKGYEKEMKAKLYGHEPAQRKEKPIFTSEEFLAKEPGFTSQAAESYEPQTKDEWGDWKEASYREGASLKPPSGRDKVTGGYHKDRTPASMLQLRRYRKGKQWWWLEEDIAPSTDEDYIALPKNYKFMLNKRSDQFVEGFVKKQGKKVEQPEHVTEAPEPEEAEGPGDETSASSTEAEDVQEQVQPTWREKLKQRQMDQGEPDNSKREERGNGRNISKSKKRDNKGKDDKGREEDESSGRSDIEINEESFLKIKEVFEYFMDNSETPEDKWEWEEWKMADHREGDLLEGTSGYDRADDASYRGPQDMLELQLYRLGKAQWSKDSSAYQIAKRQARTKGVRTLARGAGGTLLKFIDGKLKGLPKNYQEQLAGHQDLGLGIVDDKTQNVNKVLEREAANQHPLSSPGESGSSSDEDHNDHPLSSPGESGSSSDDDLNKSGESDVKPDDVSPQGEVQEEHPIDYMTLSMEKIFGDNIRTNENKIKSLKEYYEWKEAVEREGVKLVSSARRKPQDLTEIKLYRLGVEDWMEGGYSYDAAQNGFNKLCNLPPNFKEQIQEYRKANQGVINFGDGVDVHHNARGGAVPPKNIVTKRTRPNNVDTNQAAQPSSSLSTEGRTLHTNLLNPFSLARAVGHVTYHAFFHSLALVLLVGIYGYGCRLLGACLITPPPNITKRDSTPSKVPSSERWFSNLLSKWKLESTGILFLLNAWSFVCIPLIGLLLSSAIAYANRRNSRRSSTWWKNPLQSSYGVLRRIKRVLLGCLRVLFMDARCHGPLSWAKRVTWYTCCRIILFSLEGVVIILLSRQVIVLTSMVCMDPKKPVLAGVDLQFTEKALKTLADSLDPLSMFVVINFFLLFTIITFTLSLSALVNPKRGSNTTPRGCSLCQTPLSSTTIKTGELVGAILICATFFAILLFFGDIAKYTKDFVSSIVGACVVFALYIPAMAWAVLTIFDVLMEGWRKCGCRRRQDSREKRGTARRT